MTPQADDQVGQFLVSTQPRWLLDAYRAVAGLDYPIPDRRSLDEQLDAAYKEKDRKDPPGERPSVSTVVGTLRPTDFPLLTPQGALEKLQARVLLDYPPFVRETHRVLPERSARFVLPPELGVRPPFDLFARGPEDPFVEQEFLERFGEECGRRAYRRFQRVSALTGDRDLARSVGSEVGIACSFI